MAVASVRRVMAENPDDDPLRAARGIANGCVLGACLWALIGLGIYWCFR